MSKGKYSRSHKEDEEDVLKRFSQALQEDDTAPLPDPAEIQENLQDSPDSGPEDGSMPDLQNFSDLNDLQELNFPELSALDTQSEESEYNSLFAPIPPHYAPAGEEKNPQVSQEPVEKNPSIPGSHRSMKKLLISLTAVLLIFAFSLGGLTLFRHFSDPYDHKILNGVTAAGVNLGGMTKKQADEALRAAEEMIFAQDMVITLPDQRLTLSPAATKISLNIGDTVKAAYSYGRTGSRQEKEEAFRNSTTQIHDLDILPFLRVDENYIIAQLESYSQAHGSGFTPSSYALEGEQPPLDLKEFNEKNTPQTLLLILGNPGFQLDTKAALQEILEAYSHLDMAPVLTLTEGQQAPEALDLERIHQEYHMDPVDSSMDQESFQVISGSYGYTFDLDYAKTQLKKAHYGDTVRIPMEYVKPEVTDDQVYFQDVLSSVETPHGKNQNRNVNLDLACKALDGLILNPGDEFSYNETLGQRTAEKGYKPAPAYSGNKLVDSLGGGICQVSSTLYYGCLIADLEITDRINHGFLPTYIDPGMDATVSWGKPDFKFRNNMDFPIQLRAEATEDKVKIQILGTDNRDYYVKMEYTMSTTDPEVYYREYGPSSGYQNGQVIEAGVPGHYVKTFRCKYSKETDELISREEAAVSVYTSVPSLVASVKKPAPEKPDPSDPSQPDGSETPPPDSGGSGDSGNPTTPPDSGDSGKDPGGNAPDPTPPDVSDSGTST